MSERMKYSYKINHMSEEDWAVAVGKVKPEPTRSAKRRYVDDPDEDSGEREQ